MRFVLKMSGLASLVFVLVNAKVMELHRADGMVERYYVSDVRKLTVTRNEDVEAERGALLLHPRNNTVVVRSPRGIVQVYLASGSEVGIDLYSMRGAHLHHVDRSFFQAGSHGFRLFGPGGPCAGSYILRVAIGGKTHSRKVIISR